LYSISGTENNLISGCVIGRRELSLKRTGITTRRRRERRGTTALARHTNVTITLVLGRGDRSYGASLRETIALQNGTAQATVHEDRGKA
jgi:hypothetical protein